MAVTREEMRALFVRREGDWRTGHAKGLTADHASDCVVVSPTGGVLEGLDDIERIYTLWFRAFPDMSTTITDIVIDGDRAVLLIDIAGTHAGDFFGLQATGRKVH